MNDREKLIETIEQELGILVPHESCSSAAQERMNLDFIYGLQKVYSDKGKRRMWLNYLSWITSNLNDNNGAIKHD